MLRMAGLIALVAMVFIDSATTDFDPDPWIYAIAAVIIWGPGMLPGIGRKG